MRFALAVLILAVTPPYPPQPAVPAPMQDATPSLRGAVNTNPGQRLRGKVFVDQVMDNADAGPAYGSTCVPRFADLGACHLPANALGCVQGDQWYQCAPDAGWVPLNDGSGTPNTITSTPGTGAVNYYVDPGGSDAHACTSSGASTACLTIQGALNKAPKVLRDELVVHVAAGTFGGYYLSGFTCDHSFQQTTGGILIDGTLATSTLASGTATGTATGGTAGASQIFGTLVDSGQNWTTNDLVGRLITTASPAITALIESNTSTTITIVGAGGQGWITPSAGVTTYTIQDPASIINTAVNLPATPLDATTTNRAAVIASNNNCSFPFGSITFRNFRYTNSVGLSVFEFAGGSAYRIVQSQLRPTGTGNVRGVRSALGQVPQMTAPDLFMQYVDTSIAGTGNAVQWNQGTLTAFNNLYRGVAAGHSQFGVIINGTSITSFQFNEVTGFPSGLQYASPTLPGFGADRLYCGTYTNSTGLAFGPTGTVATGLAAAGQVDHVDLAVCDVGVLVNGPTALDLHGITGSAGTTALAIRNGGYVNINSANLTTFLSGDGGANQFPVNIDSGKVTAAFADFTSGTCMTTLGNGSVGCGQ